MPLGLLLGFLLNPLNLKITIALNSTKKMHAVTSDLLPLCMKLYAPFVCCSYIEVEDKSSYNYSWSSDW